MWRLLRPQLDAQARTRCSVGVIVAAHNEAKVLPATIAALLAQTDPPDAIVIADDGSIDATAKLFAEGYGLTETAAPSHSNPPERAKLQCLGIPFFGVDSRVVDPLTLKELPVGEVGEIITRGPMVFKGYWKHPEATAEAFVQFDGREFFRTGDLGRMDEEGYFFMTDRLKRMINASGFKVWPAEVEMLLYKHPAIQEACIISAKDAYRGETVKAVVVLRVAAKGQTTVEDIIGWARENMAAYKVPKIVQFVEALPKSGSGKVMWRLLQDQEAAAAG